MSPFLATPLTSSRHHTSHFLLSSPLSPSGTHISGIFTIFLLLQSRSSPTPRLLNTPTAVLTPRVTTGKRAQKLGGGLESPRPDAPRQRSQRPITAQSADRPGPRLASGYDRSSQGQRKSLTYRRPWQPPSPDHVAGGGRGRGLSISMSSAITFSPTVLPTQGQHLQTSLADDINIYALFTRQKRITN